MDVARLERGQLVSGLSKFADKLAALAESDFLGQVSRRMSERALDLIDQGYDRRSDPYGQAWAATKERRRARGLWGGKNPILEDTGAFRREWRVSQADASGFTVSNPVEYGGFHQTGTSKMPVRMTVPDNDRLGAWEEPLLVEAVNVFLEALK